MAPEDALRLGVLMAGGVQAIRMDESAMVVHGLSPRGEAAIRLHPTGRNDQYLREVREFLAGFAAGSPGGYPVHLRRWTRMGQAREDGLEKLLLFGEPEAVVSVACSAGLTDELARRVWWIMPDAANARRMLEKKCVVEGSMGKVLADYLVEFLPFENEPSVIIDTVKLLLGSGLADGGSRKKLWRKGIHDNAYYVGFLAIVPDDLPDQDAPRADYQEIKESLSGEFAVHLLRTLSGSGQTFLRVMGEVLEHPADREVVIAALDALAAYFAPAQGADFSSLPDARRLEAAAMQDLASMGSSIVFPILARTTAGGTLLRTKLDPVLSEVFGRIAILRGVPYSPARRRIRGSRS